MDELRYSDFEKAFKSYAPMEEHGNKKCANCSFCLSSIAGRRFAKCAKMRLSNEGYVYRDFNTETGFYGDAAFISLLIQNECFPNQTGNCAFYEKKWWKFWVK